MRAFGPVEMPNDGVIWLRARWKSSHPIDPIELEQKYIPVQLKELKSAVK